MLRTALLIVAGTALGLLAVGRIAEWIVQRGQAARTAEGESGQPNASDSPGVETFSPQQVVPRQRVLTGFQAVPASDVGDRLDDEELVLGVVVQGESRAYPINMMTGPRREIFNDTLAEAPIAATW